MGNNSRKFYYGDKVQFVPSRHAKYNRHLNHQGYVTGTSIHIKDNNRYTTYRVECFCGQRLVPKAPALLSLDPDGTPMQLAQQVTQVLRTLPEKYKGVVMDRFGLNPDHEFRLTHAEIGAGLNITKQRAQQIERRAFEMMRGRYG